MGVYQFFSSDPKLSEVKLEHRNTLHSICEKTDKQANKKQHSAYYVAFLQPYLKEAIHRIISLSILPSHMTYFSSPYQSSIPSLLFIFSHFTEHSHPSRNNHM